MENDYKVKLEIFEGPLDLLLYLIKKDEVDIYDIPIERITKQYLDYPANVQDLSISRSPAISSSWRQTSFISKAAACSPSISNPPTKPPRRRTPAGNSFGN